VLGATMLGSAKCSNASGMEAVGKVLEWAGVQES